VVNNYLDCGDLTKGFARIYCEDCKKSMLLPFSWKGRWFCPSCHEKKVLLFGEFITGTIAFPVPHRHYVFSLPKMLRVYFRNNRQLLKKLCRIANEFIPMVDYGEGSKFSIFEHSEACATWIREEWGKVNE